MNKQEILDLCETVISTIDNHIASPDNGDKVLLLSRELTLNSKKLVDENWPFLAKDLEHVVMGRFAAFNVIPDYMDIANLMMELDYFLKHPNESEVPPL